MQPKRPDLSGVPVEVQTYIKQLESQIKILRDLHETDSDTGKLPVSGKSIKQPPDFEIAEAPTSINVITATQGGIAKRTHRHEYTIQKRGGMGVFGLETTEDDPPTMLTLADDSEFLLLITNLARVFRIKVSEISEAQIRAKGKSIIQKLGLHPNEHPVVLIRDRAEGYLCLVSRNGMLRFFRHHIFGAYMKPGTSLSDHTTFGQVATACWSHGDQDLFVATKSGRAIRFPQKLIPPHGIQAIRLKEGDSVIGIAPVNDNSGVFLLGDDGKGTVRLMKGFSANKAPGGGGKIAMHTNRLVCAICTDDQDDIFIITKLGKIIRFRINEIPPKEGVVQGVVCISLRSDTPTTVTSNPKIG
jgi:DNA gyrase subunit A